MWNEPNLGLEWSGRPDLEEYGRFLVEVSRAIRSIGDSRIRILNGAFGLSAESAEEMFTKVPESLHAFDVWASHPYPHNHPPAYNIHDGTADKADFTIDAYLLELAVLKRFGRQPVPVMITETGYDLGNDLFTSSEGYPIIDEYVRAEYIMRAFRDYWPTYPEVVAVLPFIFCEAGWERFNWVSTDSRTGEDGLPTSPHLQYTYVRNLAKPTDKTGAISGCVSESTLGVRIPGASVTLSPGGAKATCGPDGGYTFSGLVPVRYSVSATADGYTRHDVAGVAVTVADVTRCNLRIAPGADMGGANMLGNWSMELGSGQGDMAGVALRWETFSKGIRARVSDEPARTGYLSQAISARGRHDVIRQTATYNSITPGKTYRLEVWAACRNLLTSDGQAGAWVDFDFTDNGGAVIGHVPTELRISGGKAWTAFRLAGEAPAGSKRLSVNLHVDASSGTAYFDDAYLAEGQ